MKVWKTCFDILKWLSAGTRKGKCPAKGFGPAAAGVIYTMWSKDLMIFIDSNLDEIQHTALCTSSAIWTQRWRGKYVHVHFCVLDAWHLQIVMWHGGVWIFPSCCMFTLYPLTEGRFVKEKQWTDETAIWRWYINLAITIQPPLLEVCQEIALKSHWEKAERMDHGQFVTRHTFAKKKGQQLCGSVKWKQPARTDVRASGRLHVGKGFLETLDEIVKIIQNAVPSTGFPRLWLNLPDWV